MFVMLCSHVLVAVKLVYIYSCIVTKLINGNSFHQNQFLIDCMWSKIKKIEFKEESIS